MPEAFGGPFNIPRTVALIDLPVARLHEFVEAIARFWRDASYIYNESIERKHETLEKELQRDRQQRDWLPTMALRDRPDA